MTRSHELPDVGPACLDAAQDVQHSELWDDPDTDLAIVFVGAENCHQKIRNRPALASPHPHLATVQPAHPLWASVPAEDLQWINGLACHGNFGKWVQITFQLQNATTRHPGIDYRRDLVRWAFGHLDSSARGTRTPPPPVYPAPGRNLCP